MARFQKLGLALLLVTLVFAVAACDIAKNPREKSGFDDRPAEVIYNGALDEFALGNYKQAVIDFQDVERSHPYSVWATRSQVMAAFTQYLQNEYDDAIQSLDRFVALHPGHPDAPYAFYLRALCYYERITDVERDQQITENAMKGMEEVVRRFPDSKYGKDAVGKIVLARDHLAGKEMEIGRYYQRQGECLAAINRFKRVVELYDRTTQVPEALHRMVECNLTLGLVDEARRNAAVLGYNYPHTQWYKDSYAIVTKLDNSSVASQNTAPAQTRGAKAAPKSATQPDRPEPSLLVRAWDWLF